MDLKELFVNNQNTMAQELIGNSVIKHPGVKGEDSEIKWINWFNKYLPHRYRADRAIVIDSDGNESQQIDVVIYDRTFSPPLIDNGSSVFIMAESVYAVFEVKQKITKEYIEYAQEKAASVRSLKRTFVPFRESKGISETKPQEIIAGILALESIDMDSDLFRDYLRVNDSKRILNFGCSISVAFRFDGEHIEINKSDSTINWFFYSLLSKLQQIGSVPAADYDAYLNHI